MNITPVVVPLSVDVDFSELNAAIKRAEDYVRLLERIDMLQSRILQYQPKPQPPYNEWYCSTSATVVTSDKDKTQKSFLL